jgi:DNA invertase Pin-like site-specific DNA recombinase
VICAIYARKSTAETGMNDEEKSVTRQIEHAKAYALKPRPPFQVLVMSEESRLGREQIQTAFALQQITDAGVRVFFYRTDQERKLDTAIEKIMRALAGIASEMEREKTSQRVHDALRKKAAALYVTGCKVYGYDNLEVLGPTGERLHVVRRINRNEAAIVRRLFERYVAGEGGLATLAKELNAQGRGKPSSPISGWRWSGSCP